MKLIWGWQVRGVHGGPKSWTGCDLPGFQLSVNSSSSYPPEGGAWSLGWSHTPTLWTKYDKSKEPKDMIFLMDPFQTDINAIFGISFFAIRDVIHQGTPRDRGPSHLGRRPSNLPRPCHPTWGEVQPGVPGKKTWSEQGMWITKSYDNNIWISSND